MKRFEFTTTILLIGFNYDFNYFFFLRYGEPHPEFFRGSLEEALNTACHKPAKDVRLQKKKKNLKKSLSN